METAYRVQLEVYEGPLELLYQLVEKEKIDIWDIPIARLTEQYLAYLDTLQELNIDVAAEFLVMAARLLYIKAKMLLPKPERAPGEEEEDPRLELAASLYEYKLFKEAAEMLARMAQERAGLFPRPQAFRPQAAKPYYPDPAGGATLADLVRAFQRVLERHKAAKPIPIPRVKVDVGEKVAELKALFARTRRIPFDKLFRQGATVAEVIATFLALLELVRQGIVAARQERPFAPILIEARGTAGEACEGGNHHAV